MARWVETRWWRYSIEENHTSKSSNSRDWKNGVWERNDWEIKTESIDKHLNHLMAYCNEHQYEVKSIMAIDRAQSYEYGQAISHFSAGSHGGGYGWGLGQGWGITMTDGFMALLQRIEDVSQEEFDRRMAEYQKEKIIVEERKNIESSILNTTDSINKIKSQVRELKNKIVTSEDYIRAEVTFKKGVLGIGARFEVLDKPFKLEGEAAAFQAKCQQDIVKYNSEIDAVKSHITTEKTKLNALEVALAGLK